MCWSLKSSTSFLMDLIRNPSSDLSQPSISSPTRSLLPLLFPDPNPSPSPCWHGHLHAPDHTGPQHGAGPLRRHPWGPYRCIIPTVIFQLDFAGCLATSGFAAQGAPSPPAGGKKNSYLQVCKWKKVESCSSKPTHFLLAAASESLFLSCFPQLISSWASACIWVFSDCKHPSHLCPILRSRKSLLQHRS